MCQCRDGLAIEKRIFWTPMSNRPSPSSLSRWTARRLDNFGLNICSEIIFNEWDENFGRYDVTESTELEINLVE